MAFIKGKCEYAYRKGTSNAVSCHLQDGNGKKWDFCAHQHFCRQTSRYELNADASKCPLKDAKPAEKPAVKKPAAKKSKKKKAPEADAEQN